MPTRPCTTRPRPRPVSLCLALAALLLAARADAYTAFGLNIANQIVTFDTSAPGVALSTVTVTGMQPGEQPVAIDVRPATGQLYALTNQSRVYVVNPVTGIATAVGAPF